MATNQNPSHREGPVAEAIEEQTAKLPSDLFLWGAIGSIAVSLTFKMLGKNGTANFIGQWAPTILILGMYNKLVKLQGHDGQNQDQGRSMRDPVADRLMSE
jgi:hypothetical protein